MNLLDYVHHGHLVVLLPDSYMVLNRIIHGSFCLPLSPPCFLPGFLVALFDACELQPTKVKASIKGAAQMFVASFTYTKKVAHEHF